MDAVPWTRRITELARAYQHGTVITSDKAIGSRPLRIWGTLYSPPRSAFRTALENLRDACHLDNPTLHADDYWPGKYIVLNSAQNFDTKFLVTLMAADIDILFKVTDPFWYDESETTRAWTITATILARTVSNSGLARVHPIITYRAGGAQTNVKIENVSDGNKYFEYVGALALNDVLVVDCEAGTVEVNGTNMIANLRYAFWELIAGNNSIRTTITGTVGNSRMQVVFRPRWL